VGLKEVYQRSTSQAVELGQLPHLHIAAVALRADNNTGAATRAGKVYLQLSQATPELLIGAEHSVAPQSQGLA
jgi:hypothetical protein